MKNNNPQLLINKINNLTIKTIVNNNGLQTALMLQYKFITEIIKGEIENVNISQKLIFTGICPSAELPLGCERHIQNSIISCVLSFYLFVVIHK